MKANGALVVGLATAVLRVKWPGGRRRCRVKSKVAVPPTLCFSMSSEAPQRASAISRRASSSQLIGRSDDVVVVERRSAGWSAGRLMPDEAGDGDGSAAPTAKLRDSGDDTRVISLLSRFAEVTACGEVLQFTSDWSCPDRDVQGRVPVRHHDDEVRVRMRTVRRPRTARRPSWCRRPGCRTRLRSRREQRSDGPPRTFCVARSSRRRDALAAKDTIPISVLVPTRSLTKPRTAFS